jgi:hypothetical protein
MKTIINAMIVYLEEEDGQVQVSVEMIGRPKKAVVLTDALVKDLNKIDWVWMAPRSVFTDDPPSDYLQ